MDEYDDLVLDEDDLRLLHEFLASQPSPNYPGEAAFPQHIGYGLGQPPMLVGGQPEEGAFPQFIGDGSVQQPTLGGNPEERAIFSQFVGDGLAQELMLGGDPEEGAFPQFIGDGLAQQLTLGGNPEEGAFPQFIGDGSTQPPTLGGSMEATSAFQQYIGECSTSTQPPMLGGSMEAASAFQQYIGECSTSTQPPMLGGSMEAALAFQQYIGECSNSTQPPTLGGSVGTEEMFQLAIAILEGNAQPMPNAGVMEGNDDQRRHGAGGAQQESPAPHLERYMMDYSMMPLASELDAIPLGTNQTTWPSQFDADLLLGLGMNQTIMDNSAAATDQVQTLTLNYPHDSAASTDQLVQEIPYSNTPALDYLHGSAAGTDQLVQEIPYSNTPALDYPQRPATATDVIQAQHMLDNEAMEMAELSRVASECGDEASMVWSPDEDKLLLDGLSRLANQDSVIMCMEIAYGLPKKTALDVAKRIRWFQSKNKSAAQAGVISKESAGGKAIKAQAGVISKESAGGKTIKAQAGVISKESVGRKTRQGKGIEDPIMKRNKHTPSEKTQDYKITKAFIRDNSRLMDRIDDKLRTGQLENIPGIFNDVKTNMGAILAKMREMGISTDEFKIDVEVLEEVTQSFHPSSEK